MTNLNAEVHISEKFIEAIKSNNMLLISKIPKSDLHNHAPFGGSKEILYSITGYKLPLLKRKFTDIDDMSTWCDENISKKFDNLTGFLQRIEAAFIQAKNDSINKLALNFGICAKKYFGSFQKMAYFIELLRKKHIPDTIFIPEICFNRKDPVEILDKVFEEINDLFNL